MLIKVLNRFDFRDLMVSNNIDKDNVSDHKDMFIISINDNEGSNSVSYFEGVKSDNVLVLHFDDVDENYNVTLQSGGAFYYMKVMNEDQGKEVISFMENIKDNLNDNTQLLIHCTAGQNRSGSVGKFAVDYFEYNVNKFNMDNPIVKGNPVVTSTLNRLWLWNHYSG